MGNYELIKNMSIEQMAVIIMCPNDMGMAKIDCDNMAKIDCDNSEDCECWQCCLDWLKEESEC